MGIEFFGKVFFAFDNVPNLQVPIDDVKVWGSWNKSQPSIQDFSLPIPTKEQEKVSNAHALVV